MGVDVARMLGKRGLGLGVPFAGLVLITAPPRPHQRAEHAQHPAEQTPEHDAQFQPWLAFLHLAAFWRRNEAHALQIGVAPVLAFDVEFVPGLFNDVDGFVLTLEGGGLDVFESFEEGGAGRGLLQGLQRLTVVVALERAGDALALAADLGEVHVGNLDFGGDQLCGGRKKTLAAFFEGDDLAAVTGGGFRVAGDDVAQGGRPFFFLGDGEAVGDLLVAQFLFAGAEVGAAGEHRALEVDADDGVAHVLCEQMDGGALSGLLVLELDADADHGAGLAVLCDLDAESLLILVGEGELGLECVPQAIGAVGQSVEQLPIQRIGLIGVLQVLLQAGPAGEDADETLVIDRRHAGRLEQALGDIAGRQDAGAPAQRSADDADAGDEDPLLPQGLDELAQVDLVVFVCLLRAGVGEHGRV